MLKEQSSVAEGTRLIEGDHFPIDFLSSIAEHESWRKEIFRPIYHAHKWWATRLGSIFRGVILGCLVSEQSDFQNLFYQKHAYTNITIFDPFMGSGTTIGEAHKLGCIALGRDINPVACESVRVAFSPIDQFQLQKAFTDLTHTVGEDIQRIYTSLNDQGQECAVLYYFWVKHIPCPNCASQVDLFSSYTFARNAYPERKPEVQVYCPQCGAVFPSQHSDTEASCPICSFHFSPNNGIVHGNQAKCPSCQCTFSITQAIHQSNTTPAHKLFAKLILEPNGNKRYLACTSDDIARYQACSFRLEQELEKGTIRLPETAMVNGYNTNQAMKYQYKQWRDFFNDRQLLSLGWLQNAIRQLSDTSSRDALFLLFSGILEFNNMFASYKGEGTGAVRHMFSHHILKPERTPLEANVWGTPKSSGSFSGLFTSRLLKLIDYRESPFEIAVDSKKKIFQSSSAFSGKVSTLWPPSEPLEPHGIYLSCGNSGETDLPGASVDFVITDPPFFDNVHYSELADFFFSWQRLYPRGFVQDNYSTRDPDEVQDGDAHLFSTKLHAVFAECGRVLKENGLLIFTYHHSRAEGWTSVLKAIWEAGFSIVNAHPVKSEMSGATPKSQTKEPIQLDIILVCKKRKFDVRVPLTRESAQKVSLQKTRMKLESLTKTGLVLSRNDCRIIVISQLMALISGKLDTAAALQLFEEYDEMTENIVSALTMTSL